MVSQVSLRRACKVTFGLGRLRPFSPRSPRHRAAILVCVHGPRRSGPWACERGARPASRAPSMARTRGRRTRAIWRECGQAAGLSVAARHLPIMARQRSSRCAQFGQLGFTSNRAIVTVRAAAGRQAAYGRGLEAAAYELADDARQAPKRRVLLGVTRRVLPGVLGVRRAVVTKRRARRAQGRRRGWIGGSGGSRR